MGALFCLSKNRYMDKAGITIAAAHRQALSTASAMQGGLSMMGGSNANDNDKMDREAALAEKCQMIATRGFEPLANVMGMKEW
jgi:hypothetical protein